jgi:Secretion system C-terminal sorting domain
LNKSIIVFTFLSIIKLFGQIPNSGFENWTTGNPDGWTTTNPNLFVSNVNMVTTSHSGAIACEGIVVYGVNGIPNIDATDSGHPHTGSYFILDDISLEGTTVMNGENASVTNFSLEQNYPNPLNPSTTIKYQIPKSGFVNLVVYDVLGREVSKLVNENKIGGHYEVSFDASKLTNGIYIYQLKENDFMSSKKMILLK